MKNMPVARKLILGFMIVTALCAYIGISGILSISEMNEACTMMYQEQTQPLPEIAKTIEHVQLLRVLARDAIIYSGKLDRLATIEREMEICMMELESYISKYDKMIKDSESRRYFDDATSLYNNRMKPVLQGIINDSKSGAYASVLLVELDELKQYTTEMIEKYTICMNNKVAGGAVANDETDELYKTILIKTTALIVVSIGASITLALIISRKISRPINLISRFLHRFGTKGDYEMLAEDYEVYEKRGRDEIGVCQESLYMVIQRLNEIGEVLQKVEHGDLTVRLEQLSEKDTMGEAITKVLRSLNTMLNEMHTASSQVSIGSGQVAESAQELASGSSEQAATIEELTAALTELQNHTTHNAQSATAARAASEKAMHQLKDSMRSMDEMMLAMNSIDESSNNITKVIKVIDDIAFQTNILALNAAVEAARAGQHGKGFAVVAEEVRDLASKSAAAAKETAALIEGSGESVREGNQIVTKTKANLETVSEYSRELSHLVDEVASATVEQAKTISEISHGLEQFSQVVQANSGTAEASAAASEQMSSQSLLLDDIFSRFTLLNENLPSRGLIERF